MKIVEDQIPALIREGKDKEVVPVLYQKVFPLVKKYIVSHGGKKDDAFDVFQDALLDFYKLSLRGEFKEHYKVFGYLFRYCIHKWINKVKRDNRIVWKEDISEFEMEDPGDMPYVLMGKDENLLESLFAPIGTKCIELLTCTIYNNMLMEDIMLRMGFPSVSAVKMQQHRCKQKLVEELEKRPELLDRLRNR